MGTHADDNPTELPLEQWRAGDGAAFAQLEQRFQPLLRERIRRHRAWSLLVPHCDLDDVLQEVWVRALPAARTAFHNRGRGSLMAFLGTIADHVVIDLARRGTARKRGEGKAQSPASNFDICDAARPGRSAPVTPTGFARTNELTALARTALSEREFAAWELVEMQGFGPDEAALALRCKSSSAVRGLLLRARAKLAAQLPDEGPNATATSRD
jgi:RNA polymerase sigma factor (sigma-70 family)